MPRWIYSIGPAAALIATLFPFPAQASGQTGGTAERAYAVLKKHCDKCHGAAPGAPYVALFDFRNREAMFARGQIKPGKPAESRVYLRAVLAQGGPMPPAEEKNPLDEQERSVLKEWIEAGAPAPDESNTPGRTRRAVIGEDSIIHAIEHDLETASERDRPYYRYFSLAHLYNEGAPDEQLAAFRTGLSKLINSLSWQKRITPPQPIDAAQTLLRIDMRRYSWSAATWRSLLAAYPYALVRPGAKHVCELTSCDLPYVRADWFVARSAIPPLYHDLLDLPGTAHELESRIGVDVQRNLREETAVRSGFAESGVSQNNRIVERHESLYGAYWRSYDFSGNVGKQNIFKHPLDFEEAGGEIIFNLPNGFQAYMLVNAKGARINDGPINIVSNRENPRDPVVHNGLTCMSCHARGMKRFSDRSAQLRQAIEQEQSPDFDRGKVLALYPGRDAVEKLVDEDARRFSDAVVSSGAQVSDEEPIVALAAIYDSPISVAGVAAELGVSPEVLNAKLASSGRTSGLLAVLRTAGGTIKRDAWEDYFGDVANDLALGTYLRATTVVNVPAAPAGVVVPRPSSEAHSARRALAFASSWRASVLPTATRIGVADANGDGRPHLLILDESNLLTVAALLPNAVEAETTLPLGPNGHQFVARSIGKGKPAAIVIPGAIYIKSADTYVKRSATELNDTAGFVRFVDGTENVFSFRGGQPDSYTVDPAKEKPLVRGREVVSPEQADGVYRELTLHPDAATPATLKVPEQGQKAGVFGVFDPRGEGRLYPWMPWNEGPDWTIRVLPADTVGLLGGGDAKPLWVSPKLGGTVLDVATGPDPKNPNQTGIFVLEATGDGGKERIVEFFALD